MGEISKSLKTAIGSKFAETNAFSDPEGFKTYTDFRDSLPEGEVTEKWSEKYKKSIDCNNPKGFSQRAHCQGRKKNESVLEDSSNAMEKTIIDFYKPVLNDVHKEKLPDYVDQARALMHKADDSTKQKLLDIFKKGKQNPYLQGGIITTVGALLAGGVLNSAQSMGLSPSQTNLALQGILNTVIPTLVSRINGKNWVDTIKYTLASAGVGTGIAAITEEDLEEGFGPGYPETYEQENKPFIHKGQYRITDITTESVDYLEEV